MKKIFWYIFSRLRLWYLYHGKEIPYSEKVTPYKCPCCFWDPEESYDPDYYIGSHSHYYGWDGLHSWTEVWKCPKCGTEFEIDASN